VNKNPGIQNAMRKRATLHTAILGILIILSITTATAFLRHNRFYSNLSPGQDLPAFNDLRGNPVSLNSNSIILIGRSGCPFCFEQMEILDRLLAKEPMFREWRIILVAPQNDREVFEKYKGFSSIGQILLLDSDAFNRLGKLPSPTLIICKSGGRISSLFIGLVDYFNLKSALATAQ
jgi:hypothetical protein